MNSTSPERIATGALGNIAVAPGAIASITRLRRARKLVPLPFILIGDNYATARPLALVVSVSRQTGARYFDSRSLDSAGSIHAAFLRIGVRRRRDKQRVPIGTAEHACKGVVLDFDSLRHFTTLLLVNHFRTGRASYPDCIHPV